MASVGAFNQTLDEFLHELSETFPEDETIQKQKDYFSNQTKNKASFALDTIMPELAKHADIITKKDNVVFTELNKIFTIMDFESLWKKDISENTRKAIWDYINTLLMLGTTIKTIPPNMLSEIEKIAQSCVSQMEQNQSQPDEVFVNAQKAIMNNGMLQNMAGQMPGLFQNPSAPLAPPQQTRVNHNKPNKRKGKKK